METPLTIGYVQMACQEEPAQNLERAIAGIEEAASQGAQIICLPELFLTRYFPKSQDARWFELAEPIPGPTTSRLARIARTHGVYLLVSLFEHRAPGIYHNTLVVLSNTGERVGMYRKMHIPDDPLFEEKFYFTPGDTGFQVCVTPVGTLGLLVCWDQWFPEAARLTALRGAQLLFYPTAIGWLPSEKEVYGKRQWEAWQIIQRGHAIANGCFVVAVNRVGFEPAPPECSEAGIEFWGSSFVAAPDGRLLHQSPSDREEVAVLTVDLSEVERFRREWPFFRDRRIDAYQDLTRRFIDEP